MPSSILNAKPEEIDTTEKRGAYTIGIIGCRDIGLIHACLFADAGFKVKCADPNPTIATSITRGKIPYLKREIELKLRNHAKTARLNITTDIKTAVSQSNIIVIATLAEIDEKRKTDYTDLENICKLVGSNLSSGALVIIISTVGIGITQGLIQETLENTSGFKAGNNFGLAYSPITIDENPLERLTDYERIIAATDTNSLNVASIILGTISKGHIRKVGDIKTAEAFTLFGAAQQEVNAALANELAIFCEKIGVDYKNAYELAMSTTHCALALPKITYENVQDKVNFLLENAENLNSKLRMTAISREVNEDIVKHVLTLVKDALKNCGKTLRRARIALLGIVQTQNERSPPKKMTRKIVRLLESRGAKIGIYDPFFLEDEQSELQKHIKKNLTELLEGADCILILTGHDQIKRVNLKKVKVTMKKSPVIVDLEGIFDPDEVEKEGFIYRRLGRGVWTK